MNNPFVTLTCVEEHFYTGTNEKTQKILLNINSIERVTTTQPGDTLICLANSTIVVKESFETVQSLIDNYYSNGNSAILG